MEKVYVEITAKCNRVRFFLSGILDYPKTDVPQDIDDGTFEMSVIFEFPNISEYNFEKTSNDLSNCAELFQSMLPKGWYYDYECYEMCSNRIVQKEEARIKGYVQFSEKYVFQ